MKVEKIRTKIFGFEILIAAVAVEITGSQNPYTLGV